MINHYIGETCYYYPSNINFADRYNYIYNWSFDDNTIATGYNASHIWKTPGQHITTLAITDPNNNLTTTTTINQIIAIKQLKWN